MGKRKISKEREGMLDSFRKRVESLSQIYCLEKIDDFVYALHSEEKKEQIQLSFLAIIHGNEIGGFFIFSEFVDYLLEKKPKLAFSVGIALGNLEAFKKDKRFLESDLNRAFSSKSVETSEQKRALPLSRLLERTKFLLDFHQTQRPSLKPFFIFPYTSQGLFFASHLSPKTLIVTHWGKGFSKDGMCTDEFVNKKGGVGITLETGFCGNDSVQVDFGLSVILKSLFSDSHVYSAERISLSKETSLTDLNIYTWSLVFPYPEAAFVELKENLPNFSYIKKGMVLGKTEETVIESEGEGFLLFPKYIQKGDPTPKELFRLLKKVSPEDLPTK